MSLLQSIKGNASTSYLILVSALSLTALTSAEQLGLGLRSTISSSSHARTATVLPKTGSRSNAAAGSAASVLLDVAEAAKDLKRSAGAATRGPTVPRRVPGETPTTNPTRFSVVLENEEAYQLGAIHRRWLEGSHASTDGPANKHFEIVQPELIVPRDAQRDFGDVLSLDAIGAGGILLDRVASLTSFYHQTKFFNSIEELMGVAIAQIHERPVKLSPTAFDGYNAYYNSQTGEIVHGKARRAAPPSARSLPKGALAGVEPLPEDQFVRMASGLDIPTHESYHLYRQGLAPDWARDLQSRGHGEAGGDLSGIFMAAQDPTFRAAILAETGGDLSKDSALTRLGVSVSVGTGSGPGGMRNALNSLSMSDVNAGSPHDLSRPLTGAVYDAFVAAYDSLRRDYASHADSSVKEFANELAMINAARLMFWVHDTSVRKLAGSRPYLRYHELVHDMAGIAKSPANAFGDAGKGFADELIESAKRREILSETGDRGPNATSMDKFLALPGAHTDRAMIMVEGKLKPVKQQDVFSFLPFDGN